VRRPDHSTLKDVASTIRVAISKQRSHPLVRGEPKDASLIRKLLRHRRLPGTWQSDRQKERGSRDHVCTVPSAFAAEQLV
jgi:hypothetical protein